MSATTKDKTRAIDWGSATVEHGDVSVELTGASSKAWRERFDAVRRLLGDGGAWGEVRASRNAIEVAGVAPGAEDSLRHFLESVVTQVNAGLAPGEHAPAAVADDDPQAAADREMTEKLRSFAGRGR